MGESTYSPLFNRNILNAKCKRCEYLSSTTFDGFSRLNIVLNTLYGCLRNGNLTSEYTGRGATILILEGNGEEPNTQSTIF